MITNDYAAYIRGIYEESERIMLRKVAKRLARGIDAPGWAEKKLLEVQTLKAELRAEIATLAAKAPEIGSSVTGAFADGADVAAGELGGVPATAKVPPAVEALAQELTGSVQSTHVRILRASEDAYRGIVAQAAAQSTAGTMTLREAVQVGLNAFAARGITGFIDTAGRGWDLASYVEMATRTATMNAYREGHHEQLREWGKDLIVISAHGACCPMCRPWEGRVLSLDGKTPGYPTLESARAAGLYHVNCRHRDYLYTPGLTKPTTIKYDPKAYDDQQRQRAIERHIRHWKNKDAVAINPKDQILAKQKIKDWQLSQREHIKAANLRGEGRHGEGWITLKRDSGRERSRDQWAGLKEI